MMLQSKRAADTMTIGRKLAKKLRAGDIILFSGDLGAGKTTMIQGIAQGLGVEEPVTSPSFTLMNQYEGEQVLYHFDLYRLDSIEDLWELGLEEFLYDNGISVVEWSEKLMEFPEAHLQINLALDMDDPDSRRISLTPVGAYYEQLLLDYGQEVKAYEITGY